MDCVNHSGVNAVVYCQNCGKGLCTECVTAGAMRNAPGGQILCAQCIDAWQKLQPPFAGMQSGGPNPAAAAVLGLIPGVGAMYNGQFLKGFVHVIVFALLISVTSTVHGGLDVFFGLLIPAWILYQAFEAFHTAKAMRDGDPVPDPLGLNEVGNWLNMGSRTHAPGQTGQAPVARNNPPPYASQPQPPYQAPYAQAPYAQAPPPIPPVPPPPPVPPVPLPPLSYSRHKEPVGAIVLIGLGLLFLAGQFDIFHAGIVKFGWPILLIALGVWLIVRRLEDSQGGPK